MFDQVCWFSAKIQTWRKRKTRNHLELDNLGYRLRDLVHAKELQTDDLNIGRTSAQKNQILTGHNPESKRNKEVQFGCPFGDCN